MTDINKRPNWIDFQTVTLEDLGAEQTSYLNQNASDIKTVAGTGVKLNSAQEVVVFDSTALNVEQSGWVSLNTFDGRGILSEPHQTSDTDEGNQLAITVSDAKLDNFLNLVVTVLGKQFDNSLVYEHVVFENNGTLITQNHFKEVTNLMFQNFQGNSNTTVDGYGSYNLAGTVLVTEASSLRVSPDLISNEQVRNPDIIFRDYKVYDSGKSLEIVLEEAIGPSNDVDDLNVNTTVAQTRTFPESGSTETIYAQKFQLNGNNIQKVTLLLALESGTDWSGSLVVGIRPLQTSVTCATDFLPDNEIDFDPDTEPLNSLSLDQDDLADRGIVLNSTPQPVDFIFTDSNLSNPSLSNLTQNNYYALTLQRTGSTATGTISLEEATNSDRNQKLAVFSNGIWTDVDSSTLWYRVWSDSVKVASGTAYDSGFELVSKKTDLNSNNVRVQNQIEDLMFADASEGTENYVVLQRTTEFSDQKSHPRTGDKYFSRVNFAPNFSLLSQADTQSLIQSQEDLIVLGRVKDDNARLNPVIDGTLDYPGLVSGNVINIINPGSELLQRNVVGSIITPNTSQPTLKYRITKQETFTDLYGDVNRDGLIDSTDANLINDLDGYSVYFNTTGTYSEAVQESLFLSGELDVLELIRADLDWSDGYEISSSDLTAINNFLDTGAAYPNSLSNFTRVRLEVEPILNPESALTADGESTLSLETADSDLYDGSNFSFGSGISFSIEYVPTWTTNNINVLDLRRFVNSSILDFNSDDLQSTPENGGKNSFFVAGDLFLNDNVKNLDGSFHKLDHEVNSIVFELPAGDTEGSVNIFDNYIAGKMKFSDGTLVTSSALNNSQVKFEVSISSHVKNVSDVDGYLDFDGYNDGYGSNADEAIGTFLDESTGLFRIRAYNIIYNELLPEIRTKITVTVFLKKAGFTNSTVQIQASDLASILTNL